MGKQNVHDVPVRARSILALGGFKKAVEDSWMCSECGGDNRELEAPSAHNVQVVESSSFYDASVALKGLHRAKTVLDGLLYKQSPNAEVEETTPVESAHDQPAHKRRPCTCEGAQTSRSDLPKKQNQQKMENKKQRKRQKQKKQAPVRASKSKCSESDKNTQSARPKSITIARRSGVVGRPKGLFDTHNERPDEIFLEHNTLDKNNSIENKLNNADESTMKDEVLKQMNLEKNIDSSLKNLPQARENKNDIEGFDEIQQVEDATTRDLNTKAKVGKSMSGPISSLRLGDCNDLSPVAHTKDVVLDCDAQCDSTPPSTDPLEKGREAFVDTEASKGQVEGCSETDKTTHEERLELQDAFDATPVKKGKIRSLSTVRRRKFSYVSTAVGAFVKTSSTDDLGRKLRSSRVRSYSVTSQSSVDSVGTSVDGGTSGGGGDGSGRRNKWQFENIICASNLARYTGRLPRNENGEINYTRPWRQKKKKVSKMEVNVFYAIARYMLQKQKQLRAEKFALKERLDQEIKDNEFVQNGEVANVTFQDKAYEGSDTRTLDTNENNNIEKVSSPRKDNPSVQIDTSHNTKVITKTNNPKDRANSLIPSKKDDLTMATITTTLEKHIKEDARITPTAIKKAIDRASFSSSIGNSKKKTRTSRSGSAVASTLDPDDIPNLASIIDPSKSPINLTNGVLDYDDDLSTLTSGVMLIPGRKQVRYKGILLRNYVCPQERYKAEPHMRRKKTTSIRWHAKEGAMVMSHHSAESEPASKMANVVFPKQARQRALAKMVEDNHSQPVDNSARMADAALRQKIDKFLTSVEPFCPKKKPELFS
ncbi:hypothetical protein PoB_004882700 [Plakobranchus ocellatus]|uniref:Uncharacterized protein n=1 Tax=Plakobranchus ocellatus TaxID=259542 RepID=A0AAV4BTK0_9GAST|nr:hypothetical protein PoB_004882700 [Plakobranchus ocellatus]